MEVVSARRATRFIYLKSRIIDAIFLAKFHLQRIKSELCLPMELQPPALRPSSNSNRPLFALHPSHTHGDHHSSPRIPGARAQLCLGTLHTMGSCPYSGDQLPKLSPVRKLRQRTAPEMGSEVIKMQRTAPDMVSCDVFKTLILMSFPQLCVLHLSHSFRRV
jgi:hypothetical protein